MCRSSSTKNKELEQLKEKFSQMEAQVQREMAEDEALPDGVEKMIQQWLSVMQAIRC